MGQLGKGAKKNKDVINTGGTYGQSYSYSFAEQRFDFSLTGLKPNTKHSFYFENTDKSTKCRQLGKTLGQDLITDAYGNLSFEFYYESDIPHNTVVTEYVQAELLLSNLAGIKRIKVSSIDNTSIAEDLLTFTVPDKEISVPFEFATWNVAFNSGPG